MSEVDNFSDSDWLDIASNREESDTESVGSNNGGASSSLSRRSSFSTTSSQDGEIQAWEGFVEDVEAEVTEDDVLHSGEDHSSPFLDLDKDPTEDRRVRDGLDQSLMSTLSASRTSSHPSTVQNSLQNLRLSFPDPLNNSHDELNRSYDRVSSTEATFSAVDSATEEDAAANPATEDDELDSSSPVAMTGSAPIQDPGLPSTPEVFSQDSPRFDSNGPSANLQVVLYGSSSSIKYDFAEELFRKATVGADIDKFAETVRPQILDRTGDAASTPRSECTPDRPSLAIVYHPYANATIPQHTAYLPVIIPTNNDLFEKEFQEAREAWASYNIPTHRILRLEASSSSMLFAAEDVHKLDPYHTHQALQRIMKQEKTVSWFGMFEQFNTVHAVTLFALLCLITGFSVNTALSAQPLKGFTIISPSPTIAGKSNSNQSTALAVRTTSSISLIPAAINYAPARGAVSASVAGPSTAASSPSTQSGSRDVGPITHVEDTLPMTWTERLKVSKEIMVRPSTSVSAQTSSVVSSAVATTSPASSAVTLRLVDSLSEIVAASFKSLIDAVEHDLKDLILALDELAQAIKRSTRAVTEQSKSAAQVIREQFEYRNARAKGKAREIREKGMQMISDAGSSFWGRTNKAKERASFIKDLVVSSDAWNSYVKSHGEWRDELRARARHARHRARHQKDGMKSRSNV